MPIPHAKQSGANNYNAQKVKVYNNTAGEITHFGCIADAEKELGCHSWGISTVLSKINTSEQTYSKKFNAYFQAKYHDDNTPFIKDMPTPKEKSAAKRVGTKNSLESKQKVSAGRKGKYMGVENHTAKPVVVYGVAYGHVNGASDALRDTLNMKGMFVNNWLKRNTRPCDAFRISKDFYNQIDHDVYITREMYNAYEHFAEV